MSFSDYGAQTLQYILVVAPLSIIFECELLKKNVDASRNIAVYETNLCFQLSNRERDVASW